MNQTAPSPSTPSGPPVVIFAGGGTGGHLYPGLAIAEQVRERMGAGVRCRFVCSDRPLDAEILKKAGAEFVPACAKPLSLHPLRLARFLRTWGRAIRESRALLRAAKKDAGDDRVVVVAMGGFVAAPVAQAAALEHCPLLLVNLDAIPGKANRFVAWRARRNPRGGVVSTIPVRDDHAAAWPVIGPLVRSAARAVGSKAECRTRLGLEPARPVLMVTGGSQGARSINSLLVELAKQEVALFRTWQILHQCGKGEEEAVSAGYAAAGVEHAQVSAFSDRMGDWWGAADLAVSRSGAGSVAEAWANRVPCIFMPYPYHKDQHQRWNAEPLEKAGAGVVVTDRVLSPANLADAGRIIADLMRDAPRRESMRTALSKLGSSDGASEIAARVLALLRA